MERDYWEHRYWPFEVPPPEQRTALHQQQIAFLEAAYREGFRPYTSGSESFGASAGGRSGEIILRTRRFWELRLGAAETGGLAAYVSGFDVNAEAMMKWLRGEELMRVLEFIRQHLVPAGGRSSGFSVDPPSAVEA